MPHALSVTYAPSDTLMHYRDYAQSLHRREALSLDSTPPFPESQVRHALSVTYAPSGALIHYPSVPSYMLSRCTGERRYYLERVQDPTKLYAPSLDRKLRMLSASHMLVSVF